MDTEGKSPGVWSNPPPMLCKEHAAYIIEMAIKRQQVKRILHNTVKPAADIEIQSSTVHQFIHLVLNYTLGTKDACCWDLL